MGSCMGHTIVVNQGMREKRGWPRGWRTMWREMASSQGDYPSPEGPASGSPMEVHSTCRDSSLPRQSKLPVVVGWVFQLQISQSVSSVAQSCLTLHNPMDCSTPGLPIHHQLLELTQTHLHWVGDAIQPSHPLSSPSPPAFNLSQYQGLFKWVSSSHQVAKVLEFQLQHQSFQWTLRT